MTMARAFALSVVALFVVPHAHAQTVEDFYSGRTIELYIGSTVGGGYDA